MIGQLGNLTPNSVNNLLQILSLESRGVYLCGSRYFAQKYPEVIQVEPSTDIDFRCEFNLPLIKDLIDLSPDVLVTHGRSQYLNEATVGILLFDNMQVCIDSSPATKEIFHNMTAEFYRDFIWKSGPKRPNRSSIKKTLRGLHEAHPLFTKTTEQQIDAMQRIAISYYNNSVKWGKD